MDKGYVLLTARGVLALDGADRRSFLQGLVTNDVNKVGPDRAVHAALLTPQGKYLHDFFIAEQGETLLIDCEAGRAGDLMRRLRMYKLRSKITLDDATSRFAVAALFGAGTGDALGLPDEAGRAAPLGGGGIAVIDPRLPALGARAILPRDEAATSLEAAGFQPVDLAAYEQLRLEQGVPDASRDLAVEKALLLESNFDSLNGISWDKGCYMGQELTARTRYRGLVRKRLMPVTLDGPLPTPGTPVMLGDKEAGEIRSGLDGRALALLRLEELEKSQAENLPLMAGETRVTPHRPDWLSTKKE
jgi:folate-binding protein YgfZ